MNIIDSYDRHFFEIHQQSENGKWYRLVSSGRIEDGNEKEKLAEVLAEAKQRIGWQRGLESFLPVELIRVGKLRLVRVHRHNEVYDLDVKKALRVAKVSSK